MGVCSVAVEKVSGLGAGGAATAVGRVAGRGAAVAVAVPVDVESVVVCDAAACAVSDVAPDVVGDGSPGT